MLRELQGIIDTKNMITRVWNSEHSNAMLAKLILEETDREKIIRCMTEVAKVFEKGILALMEGKEPPSGVNQL